MFAPRRLCTAVCVISLRASSFNLKQVLGKLVVDTRRQSDLYYLLGGDRRVHHYWCTGAHHHHHHPVMRGASIVLQSWPQSCSCRCNCICGSPCSPSRESGVGVSGMFTYFLSLLSTILSPLFCLFYPLHSRFSFLFQGG